MGIIETITDLVGLVKKIDNAELNSKIIDLQSQVYVLNEENSQKHLRIKELEELLSVTDKIVFRNPFYYFEGENDPLCPGCWDGNKKVVHLLGESGRSQHCPICDNKYVIDENSNVRNIRKKK